MVIFGASGDLAHRKLIPAVYALAHEGLLPPFFSLIGVANGDFDRDGFRNDMREAVGTFSRYKPINETVWNSLAAGMDYVKGDFDNPKTYEDLAARLKESDEQRGTQGNRLFYLSTAPSLFEVITRRLKQHGISDAPGWQRVVIEKPFGRDLASARELNQHLKRIFVEEEIFRIDHYLGKETVQNILVLRFANGLFEPVWRNQFIDHVQITVAETLGIGHRSGYYEEAGAARDMMQNHMMQLLALIAMEPPISLGAEQIRNEKVKVLEALRRIKDRDIGGQTVRGQYGRGYVGGAPVNGYREETGVSPQSRTETFGCVKLFIDSWRWSGVPFYLRHSPSRGPRSRSSSGILPASSSTPRTAKPPSSRTCSPSGSSPTRESPFERKPRSRATRSRSSRSRWTSASAPSSPARPPRPTSASCWTR
jgi:glucose-6-phosphate 1-dehydrogenase